MLHPYVMHNLYFFRLILFSYFRDMRIVYERNGIKKKGKLIKRKILLRKITFIIFPFSIITNDYREPCGYGVGFKSEGRV